MSKLVYVFSIVALLAVGFVGAKSLGAFNCGDCTEMSCDKDKKKCCKKKEGEGKKCCKKKEGEEAKACCKKGEEKACCKKKEGEAASEEAAEEAAE